MNNFNFSALIAAKSRESGDRRGRKNMKQNGKHQLQYLDYRQVLCERLGGDGGRRLGGDGGSAGRI